MVPPVKACHMAMTPICIIFWSLIMCKFSAPNCIMLTSYPPKRHILICAITCDRNGFFQKNFAHIFI